jgi:phosphatidate phosphatase LPIN
MHVDASRRARARRTTKVQSTHATPEQLAAMAEHLQLGQNLIEFEANGQRVRSFLYLLDWNIRLIISDIDGTITKSDMLGHVLPRFGNDWSHPGITRLFSNIAANGYQFMFLSSRSIAQSDETRAYLVRLKAQGHAMPAGALVDLFLFVLAVEACTCNAS